jgi:ubiquinone/menaquinone biosynthesis C-methylase UbiE
MNQQPLRHRFWRRIYDLGAFAYDAVLSAGAWLRIGSEEHIRREVIGNVALAPDALVIDLGCGTAASRPYLRGRIRYFGLDLSRGMLVRAQRKCVGLHIPADFVQTDTTALPFSRAIADLVLAMGVLQHVTRIDVALGEMSRLSKPDGSILIIDEQRSQKRITQMMTREHAKTEKYGEYFVLRLVAS